MTIKYRKQTHTEKDKQFHSIVVRMERQLELYNTRLKGAYGLTEKRVVSSFPSIT